MTNVLLTCAIDTGVGGVQVVFGDLVHWPQNKWTARCICVYEAPLPSVGLVETINAMGPSGFYCPMPAIVRDSVLLSVPVFFGYLPITFFTSPG